MAVTNGSLCTVQDFIALKARVKAECARRKYMGDISQYASNAYDYENVPDDGEVIAPEDVNKLIVPMNAINDTGYTVVSNGDIIKELSGLEEFLTVSEGYSLQSPSTNCRASCTGLCVGTCADGCVGCSGGCEDNCDTGCMGTCTGECTGCTSCTGTCSTSCTGTCQGTCSGSCSDGCTGCKGCAPCTGCTGTCTNTCKGCSGTCSNSCSGGCVGTCKSSCSGVAE